MPAFYSLLSASGTRYSFRLVSSFSELDAASVSCINRFERFTESTVRKAFENKKIESLHELYAELFLENELCGVAVFQVLTVGSEAYPDFSFLSAAARALYSLFSSFTLKLVLSGNYFNPTLPAIFFKSKESNHDSGILELLFTQIGRLLNADAVILQNTGSSGSGSDCSLFKTKRFKELRGDVLMQMPLHPEWLSLSDYTNSLQKKYRARVQKLLKDCAGIQIKTEGIREWTQKPDQFYKLYSNIYNRSSFRPVRTSEAFFRTMLEQEPERFYLRSFYSPQGSLLAWSTLYRDALGTEIFYIGVDTSQEEGLEKIYPLLLLDGLEQAILQRSPCLLLGRTGREAKSMLGAVGIDLPHRVWFRNSLLKFFSNNLIRLAQQNEWKPVNLRNPFKALAEN